MFDTEPVVFVPDGGGVVFSRSRGWRPADAVWPEPPEMLKRHRCRDTRRDPVPVGAMLPTPAPNPAPGTRRRVRWLQAVR